jgi:hypothetical protein
MCWFFGCYCSSSVSKGSSEVRPYHLLLLNLILVCCLEKNLEGIECSEISVLMGAAVGALDVVVFDGLRAAFLV